MEELFYSMTHRWYVTLFLVSWLIYATLQMGLKRTLFWLVSAYLVAFVMEWNSINDHFFRFPFGSYEYKEEALSKDLLVFGVPFFDSLSFAFLSYVAFTFAQFFVAPIRRRGADVQVLATRKMRNGLTVLLLGTFLMLVIDVLTDPAALQGKHTFLGDIYFYSDPGYHFGVPMTNYFGWLVTGLVAIFINQRFDSWLAKRETARNEPLQLRHVPLLGLVGPLFWTGIVFFQVGITWWLGYSYDLEKVDVEDRAAFVDQMRLMLIAGVFVIAPILFLAWINLRKGSGEPTPEEVEAYRADYPGHALPDASL